MLCNKSALVCEAPVYPRNGTSVGMSASGLAHHTMKHGIQALACWNCTQSVLYTVQPEKSGYGHEWVNCSIKHTLHNVCFI